MLRDPEAAIIGIASDHEEASAVDDTSSQVPVGMPEPDQPTRAEKARHDLTHITYRSWCPHCVAGRRPSDQHRSQPRSTRNVPIFCSDFAFLRDAQDEDLAPVLVGRLYPSRALFATVCDAKSHDDAATRRLANFLKESGVSRLVYKSDQESSLKLMVENALARIGKSGTFEAYEAVPEYSAVGSSASNGRAERAVQTVEDQIRTLKSAIESRMKTRLPSDTPTFRWLVEHCVSIINRFKVHAEGTTSYEASHGKRCSDKVVEFGEQVLFSVPKRLRSKLCRRFRLGTYLGVVQSSNEHYVALANGNVIRTRSVCRVVEGSRWNAAAILGVKGTPSLLCPMDDETIGPDLEGLQEPHLDRDHDVQLDRDGEVEGDSRSRMDVRHQTRITARDLRMYGFTPGCPRCSDLRVRGHQGRRGPSHNTSKEHSSECRLRMYLAWETNNDPKFERIKHIVDPVAPLEPRANIELDHGFNSGAATPRGEPAAMTPPGRPWDLPDDDINDDEALDMIDEDYPASGQWDESGRWDPSSQQDIEYEPYSPDSPAQDADGDEAMLDYLMSLGVTKVTASATINSMRSERPPATFMEIYGGGAIKDCANKTRRDLNVKGLNALDLRTMKPDGQPWNFSQKADRQMARALIDKDNPDWIIGSPPCTAFSIWNYAMNYPKMDPEKVKQAVAEGKVHLDFVVSLYRKQLAKGKHFLHEHPATALSWKEETVLALIRSPLVFTVVADQCMYGLTAPLEGDKTQRGPAKKPTRFMTSSSIMRDILSTRCDQSHVHQQLTGGRARDAAFYPMPLVEAILKGIALTADSDAKIIASLNGIRSMEENHNDIVNAVTGSSATIPNTKVSNAVPTSSIKRVTGGVLPIAYHQDQFKQKYVDEYTGEVLDSHLIQAAIMEELDYFNDRVWEIETKDDMFKIQDHVFVRSRWVMCNKGDAENPDIRARLVACEINKGDKQDNFFASTPPLEAKKILFAQFTQERHRNGKPLRLSFVDVRKAYFNGIPKRPLYMAFPKELGLPANLVAKQVRCVYGTRDAGAIWEDTYRDALENMGFQSGKASPCCFYHPERNISIVVHGDDFTALGLDADLDYYETELAKNFELKIRGRLGEGCKGDNQIRILNRIVTLTPEGLTYEADPRHADLLCASMGLTDGAKAVLTPGLKEPEADYDAAKHHEDERQPDSDQPADGQEAPSSSRTGVPDEPNSDQPNSVVNSLTSSDPIQRIYVKDYQFCVEKRFDLSIPCDAIKRSLGKLSGQGIAVLKPSRTSDDDPCLVDNVSFDLNRSMPIDSTSDYAFAILPNYSPNKPRAESNEKVSRDKSSRVLPAFVQLPHRVQFSKDLELFDITPYAEIYGIHPRFIAATSEGFLSTSAYCDPFTSRSDIVMKARHAKQFDRSRMKIARDHRRNILAKFKAKGVINVVRSDMFDTSDVQQNGRSKCRPRRNAQSDCYNHYHESESDDSYDYEIAKGNQKKSLSVDDRSNQAQLFSPHPMHASFVSEATRAEGREQHVYSDTMLDGLPAHVWLAATRTAPAKTHGAKRQGAKAVKVIERESTSYKLSSEDATLFRALSARANYLSQDRADIGFSTKELCREFSVPNRNSMGKLKRVVRYLAGKPRLLHCYNWGKEKLDQQYLEIYVDTDFAGCKETRRSTNGGVCLLGGCNVRQWAKTQTTLALSSGEAELHGINMGITQGLGLQSLAKDLGFDFKIRVHSDATAAIGMCRRRGLGKVRHLDVSDLWAQDKIRNKKVELVKVLGAINPADIMTKYTNADTLNKMLNLMGMRFSDGRAACAPAISKA